MISKTGAVFGGELGEEGGEVAFAHVAVEEQVAQGSPGNGFGQGRMLEQGAWATLWVTALPIERADLVEVTDELDSGRATVRRARTCSGRHRRR